MLVTSNCTKQSGLTQPQQQRIKTGAHPALNASVTQSEYGLSAVYRRSTLESDTSPALAQRIAGDLIESIK